MARRSALRQIGLALLLICTGALTGCAQNLFYQPDNILYDTPTRAGLPFEEVTFQSEDGTSLTGWFIPAHGATPPQKALATVIQFHGNAQNMSAHWRFGQWLPRRGFNLFVFDYRGYGTSKGQPSPKGLFEDSRAAIDYVRRRPDVDPQRLIVFGQSLGGTNAIAAVGSGERAGVRAIVIESTFSSYSAIAHDKVPGSGILMSDAYSADRFVGHISPIPLLLIHGNQDKVISLEHARRLIDLAKEPKQLITVEGGQHIEAFAPRFGRRYQDEFIQFVMPFLAQP